MEPNMIGAYGPWAASLAGDGPARLSFRNAGSRDLDAWRREARGAARRDCSCSPTTGGVARGRAPAQVRLRRPARSSTCTWQLPYGPPTEALLPQAGRGDGAAARPSSALHDHGGNKYFGTRKIAQISDELHPMMKAAPGATITAA